MDVTMPDGTVVQNVPDGTTKAQLAAKYQAHLSSQPDVSGDTLSNVGRGLGLGTRDIIEGVLAPFKLGANAVAGVGNLALKGADAVSGGKVPYRLPYQGEAVSDALGLPTPTAPSEQAISGINRSVAGAASGMGIGSAVGGAVGNALMSQPVRQLAGAVTGGAASEAVKAGGGGPVAQMAAGMFGGAIPASLGSALPALGKRMVRGSATPQDVQDNINAFQQAGASPSAGQATQNRLIQGTESLLSRTPGAAGVMARAGTQQAQDLGAGIEAQASTLAPKSSPEQAGRLIDKGVSGEGGFVDKFKQTQGQLYDKLDQFIPASQPVNVDKTKTALDALNADIPGAPNVSKLFKNSKIQGIDQALSADTGAGSLGGTLPYEAVKKLRTLVGNQLSDWSITSDVPRSKWKALYGALSDDLQTAAQKAGPDAQQAWSRANNYTRAGMDRLDTLNSVVEKSGGPEKIFSAATSGTKEGATTLRAVMQSLPDDGQKMISATVLRRLGRATNGQQNALGDKFSTETFLTNWNSLAPEAKSALFDRYGPGFRQAMDNVASVASNLRSGSKVWQNPSGTSQAAAQATAATTLVGSLLTGHLGVAATVGAGMGGANLTARLLTNPTFVRWLATNTAKPVGAIGASLNALAQYGAKTGDQDLIDGAQALQKATNQQTQ